MQTLPLSLLLPTGGPAGGVLAEPSGASIAWTIPSPALWILLAACGYAGLAVYLRYKPVPPGLHGPPPRTFRVPAERVGLWFDETRCEGDRRYHDLRIVDLLIGRLRSAQQALLDVFLLDLHGTGDQPSSPDTRRLAEAVRESGVELCVLVDPVNTHYHTRPNPPFEWLEQAGARVVEVRLEALRHNNLPYAPLYTLLAPLLPRSRVVKDYLRGDGRVSPYAVATAIAARADHRKVLLTRSEGVWSALIASANLSDSTAYYDDVAVTIEDHGVASFLLAAECALVGASSREPPWFCAGQPADPAPPGGPVGGEPVGEGPAGPGEVLVTPLLGVHIGRAILRDLARTRAGDRVVVGVLFLSSRAAIREIVRAQRRGVDVHVVMDSNRESFGARAGGFPNRLVALELLRRAPGIDVRWHLTDTEFHTKFVWIVQGARCIVHAGSANLTRRSLLGTNLETNVRLEMACSCPAARQAAGFVDRLLGDACSRPVPPGPLPRWLHTAYVLLERVGLTNC